MKTTHVLAVVLILSTLLPTSEAAASGASPQQRSGFYRVSCMNQPDSWLNLGVFYTTTADFEFQPDPDQYLGKPKPVILGRRVVDARCSHSQEPEVILTSFCPGGITWTPLPGNRCR